MTESLMKEKIFNAWAPPGGLWSPWVKPVLFACMDLPPGPDAALVNPAWNLDWVPPVEENTTIVLDLPREDGVLMGLELAKWGYRPVPLYNAIPEPTIQELSRAMGQYSVCLPVVDVVAIRDALWRGTAVLAQLSLPPDAPPVFLLDANRRTGNVLPMDGYFDNRSVSFTTDFPSALFLQSHGINRAILVQYTAPQPQADLAHTLRRWQKAGMDIRLKRLDFPGSPLPCTVAKPWWFGAIWYRLLVSLGLRRHALGGYGGIIGLASGG